LNQESRGDDVSGSYAVNLSSLQLLEEADHNIYASIMIIAWCCRFAGKYLSGTDVRRDFAGFTLKPPNCRRQNTSESSVNSEVPDCAAEKNVLQPGRANR